MKRKKLFIIVLSITLILLIICILMHKKEQNIPTPIPIHKPIDKEEVIKKSISELQQEINSFLKKEPINFSPNSTELNSSSKKRIDKIISILKQIDKNIAIEIISYSDMNGSRSFNHKLTQKRSNAISEYIKGKYDIKYIYAIGYGKEFLLSKDSNKTENMSTEINIKRIRNDF